MQCEEGIWGKHLCCGMLFLCVCSFLPCLWHCGKGSVPSESFQLWLGFCVPSEQRGDHRPHRCSGGVHSGEFRHCLQEWLQIQGVQQQLWESAAGWKGSLHALGLFMELSEADPVQYRVTWNRLAVERVWQFPGRLWIFPSVQLELVGTRKLPSCSPTNAWSD